MSQSLKNRKLRARPGAPRVLRRNRQENKTVPANNLFSWVEIDLDSLRYNLRQLCRFTRRDASGVMGIVKADAYGHGMTAVAKALYQEGVRFFGVANLEEAMLLRGACSDAKILVLGSFCARQVPDYTRHNIRPTISCLEDLRIFNDKAGKPFYPVHLKIDSGMSRLGLWHETALNILEKIKNYKNVSLEGLYTHLSSADEDADGFSRLQLYRFEGILNRFNQAGIFPKYIHAANSLALTRFPNARHDLIRPGIMLYGINPWKDKKLPFLLKPVLSFKTRISYLKNVHSQTPLSYGRTYVTASPTQIATLPVGYSHGFRVGFSNNAFVLVHGTRCPVVGRVTMDQTLVDVGAVHGVKRWDEVTLIGREKNSEILAENLANWAGTIPYEIVCAIHSRIPRVYKGL